METLSEVEGLNKGSGYGKIGLGKGRNAGLANDLGENLPDKVTKGILEILELVYKDVLEESAL